ncbi:acetolactate synthase, large subunit, biosynthetic type [PVC group bacterium (ex Bugula neritina AB1)]|nr:acetolactate synthase, large subunit, biosynthetic type [PVC group bacterium (ex Bugula neritina AB1)]
MKKEMLNGAEALVKCLESHGVEYIFGHPGGAALPIFDALVDSPIKFILTRHEQGATHMADGYARSTGKVGVALVTSGPGATNTVTGLLTSHMDSVPIIVLSGQVISPMLGKNAFQEADITGITMSTVKHNYLVKDPNDIPRVIKESFLLANTKRPGPILIDLPKDVTSAPCEASLDAEVDLPGYNAEPLRPDKAGIAKMAELLAHAERPLILAGHGILISRAGEEIISLAEKLQAPVTNTLLGKGSFPETHPLSLGMLGMHGTAYANKALVRCDLIFSIGSRWDDRINGDNSRFCINAKKLHIDIDPSEINKIVKPDAYVIGDARTVLKELLPLIKSSDTKAWVKEVQGYKKKYPLDSKKKGGLKARNVIHQCYEIVKGQAIVTTDVGQHQMWAAQYFLTDKPHTWLSSGGSGTMGYGFPAAIGAQFGNPHERVIAIVGDGGFQMTLAELATVAIHKLPVKILIIDNKYLGMVRQWQELFFDDRLMGVDLEGNPDFIQLAKAYGIKGFRVRNNASVKKVLTEAMNYNEGPCLIHAEVMKEANVFPMIPAGQYADKMILKKPLTKMEKPTGST